MNVKMCKVGGTYSLLIKKNRTLIALNRIINTEENSISNTNFFRVFLE